VRRRLERAARRAADPELLRLVTSWEVLEPHERRLAYLHRVLGVSLRGIARDGLVKMPRRNGRSGGAACVNTLRAWMRKIERKIERATRDRHDRGQDQPPAG
jgi:hypothetical protein